MAYYNGPVEIYFKDSKLALPHQKYEWLGFVNVARELTLCSSGTYINYPNSLLIRDALNSVTSSSFVPPALRTTTSIVDASFNDVRIGDKVIREFSGTVVRFEKNQ
jgi:hypothetical protein